MSHPVLPIAALDRRHPGLTPAIAATYTEAAAVCLGRHHETPTEFELQDNNESIIVTLLWEARSSQTRMAWGNAMTPLNPGLMLVTGLRSNKAEDFTPSVVPKPSQAQTTTSSHSTEPQEN